MCRLQFLDKPGDAVFFKNSSNATKARFVGGSPSPGTFTSYLLISELSTAIIKFETYGFDF